MATNETVLITGGTGFIGGYTAAQLLDRGHDVVSFDLRTDSPVLEYLGISDDVRTIEGDITDETALFRAVENTGTTRIIHLAALLTGRTRTAPRKAIDVNITATNTVFEVCRTYDEVERVVWASSSAVYGPPGTYGDRQLTEDDPLAPSTLYGAAKMYNESQASVYREDHGISDVAIRPTLVYGPGRESGSATTYSSIITDPARGEPVTIGPGETVIDWQYVTDTAQAFRKATFAPEENLSRRRYNVCGQQATLDEVAEIVRESVSDAEVTITDEGEYPWTHTMDDSSARSDLGYEPQYGIEEGVRELVSTIGTLDAR